MTNTKIIYMLCTIATIISILCNPFMMILSYASSTNSVESTLFEGGDGTEESPYLISTPEQLKNIEKDLEASYKLVNDIDLTYDTTNENGLFYNNGLGWIPINGSFKGRLDGNEKKIIGLHQERIEDGVNTKDMAGIFQYISNAQVYNLNITNLKITYNINGLWEYTGSKNDFGALSYSISNSELNSINLSGEIEIINNGVNKSAVYNNVGGYASYISNSSFTKCTNNVNIKSDFPGKYGGFASESGNGNELNLCVNNGNIEAVDATIINDYYVAGLIAWVDDSTNFTSCTNNGILTGKSVAGIVSYFSSGNVKFCNNYGKLNIYSMNSGGIVGTAFGTKIEECFNAGTLNIYASMAYDDANIGGIVGRTYYTAINNKYGVTIDFTGTLKNIYNIGTINVYSSNINANIGGIVGYLKGNLQLCYNLGNVDLTKYDSNAIYYAANDTYPVKSGTFTAGTITGASESNSIYFNCYHLEGTAPIVITGRSKTHVLGYFDYNPLTLNEILLEDSFSEFDFNNIWNMSGNNNYDFPQLNNNSINGISAKSIELNQANINLTLDETYDLQVTINPINSTNQKCEWSSSDSSIVMVNNTGKITAISHGTATITVILSNGLEATCEVNVKYRKGDINGDGKINIKDWNKMYAYITETSEFNNDEFELGDINRDGKVNIKDWNRMYNHINGTDLLY